MLEREEEKCKCLTSDRRFFFVWFKRLIVIKLTDSWPKKNNKFFCKSITKTMAFLGTKTKNMFIKVKKKNQDIVFLHVELFELSFSIDYFD